MNPLMTLQKTKQVYEMSPRELRAVLDSFRSPYPLYEHRESGLKYSRGIRWLIENGAYWLCSDILMMSSRLRKPSLRWFFLIDENGYAELFATNGVSGGRFSHKDYFFVDFPPGLWIFNLLDSVLMVNSESGNF